MLRVEFSAGWFWLALAFGGPEKLIRIFFDRHYGLIQLILLVLKYFLGVLRGQSQAEVLLVILILIRDGIIKGCGPVFCHSMIIDKVYAKFIKFIRRL